MTRNSSENTPLIEKSELSSNYNNFEKKGPTSHINFICLLFFGSLIFLFLSYALYSLYVVKMIRCRSGNGQLIVNSITLSNLENVEILNNLDQDDPYVLVQFRGILQKTSVFENSGSTAKWEDLNFSFPITQSNLNHGKYLYISVLDDNVMLDDERIGKVNIILNDYISAILKEKQVFSVPKDGDSPIDLLDEEHRVTGSIRLDLELICTYQNSI